MALTSSEANGRHRLERLRERRKRLRAETDELLNRVEQAIQDREAKKSPPAAVVEKIRHLSDELGEPWASEADPITNLDALDAIHRLQWWPRPVKWIRMDDEPSVDPDEEPIPLLGYSSHYRENGS